MKRFLPFLEGVLLLQLLGSSIVLISTNSAGIWFLLSALILASFYMFATYFLVQHLTNNQKIKDGADTVFILICQVQIPLSIIGFLFKILSWPGAAIYLLVSAICLLFISIILALKQVTYFSVLVKRIVFFGLLSALLYWWPISSWIHFRYSSHPSLILKPVFWSYLKQLHKSILQEYYVY